MDYVERKTSFKNVYNLYNNLTDIKKQLILEKIKLEENPEYKKFLQTYFNDPSKYFLKAYKNNPIVIWKKYNKNKSFKIKIDLKHSPKKKPKKAYSIKNEIITSSDQSSSDQNKQNMQKDNTNTNNNLKAGQRYINDLELNDIFSNFKSIQKINRNKIRYNLTVNDIKKFRAENLENSKSIKARMVMRKKTIKLMKKLNSLDINQNENNNTNNSNKIIRRISTTDNNISNTSNSSIKKTNKKNSIDKTKKVEFNINTNDSFPNTNRNNNTNINTNNVLKNNQTLFKEKNTITIPNDSPSKSNYNISKNENNSSNYNFTFNRFLSSLNENKIDIYQKQRQFLTTEKFRLFKKELGKSLVSQEKTFINDINSKNQAKKISIYMSNKLKIPKDQLLMNKTEYFRINTEMKSRLSNQVKHEFKEKLYDWEKNLKNFDHKIKYEETIIDPIYNNYPKKRFYSLNNEYLTKRIPIKNLKKFVNNIDNIKKNFNGLYIKGKNLLELEHELAKGIKGKKILNNFEEILPYSSLRDEVYAKHFQL